MASSIVHSIACFFFLLSISSGVRELSRPSAVKPPPAMFVFGDSLSDTGNGVSAFPFQFDSQNSPYGSTFFHSPTGRWSDGRVMVDFLASKWGLPFLEPFFKNIDTNYGHGINFAVTGATARNDTIAVPFYLPTQTDQFIRFKRNVLLSLKSEKECVVSHVPPATAFKEGTYVIFSGMSDILYSIFSEGQSPVDVKREMVPLMITAISKAIVDLHKEGGKKFMVFNIMPLGCTPLALTVQPQGLKDKLGCLKDVNEVIDFANHELEEALKSLKYLQGGISIQVADLNSFALGAIANPERYGFRGTEKFKACCGHGGAHNFDLKAFCGDTGKAKACINPEEHVSWDGLHYTDAFSQRFVQELLKGSPLLKPANI